MVDNLAKALGCSVLLHLLVFAALWLTRQPLPQPVSEPKAIHTYIYQSLPRPPQPVPEQRPTPPAQEPIGPPQQRASGLISQQMAQDVTELPASTVTKTTTELTREQATERAAVTSSELANTQPTAQSQTTDASLVIQPASNSTASMSLTERSLAIASRRHPDISSADLAASQQRLELRDRPATTGMPSMVPAHAADNVIMVMRDGSFLEKVDDYCYLATPGANLRADIFSMKPVSCGEDKKAILFDRIMQKVGQDR